MAQGIVLPFRLPRPASVPQISVIPSKPTPRANLEIYMGRIRERGFDFERSHAGELHFSTRSALNKPRSFYTNPATLDWLLEVERPRLQFAYDYAFISPTLGALTIQGPARCDCAGICRHGIDQVIRVQIRPEVRHGRWSFICSSCGGKDVCMNADAIAGGNFMCAGCGGDYEYRSVGHLIGCFRVRESEGAR
jgi:hypothetical protein